jgi:uncharacterized membrane protein SpoIIM required for sporulation
VSGAPNPQAQLRSERFRDERERDWRELDRLVNKAEKRRVTALTDDELLALPVLYRSALSALSAARATSLDKALTDYLESLCARAYFFVYGVRGRPLERVVGFLARDLPAAVKALWRETLICTFITTLGVIVAWLLVRADPDWFYSLMSGGAQGRDPAATTEFLRHSLHDDNGRKGLAVFAAELMTHNSGVALKAFATGFAFGIPSLILLFMNGCSMGALIEVYAHHGLGLELAGWLAIHGVTELFATILAGAAGLKIGLAVAFPHQGEARMDALVRAGRQGGVVMGGVVMMLVFAGLLEGIGRQVVQSETVRFVIAAATAVFWFGYYYLPRRERDGG